VALDDLELALRQRPRLLQDLVGNAQLADVVEETAHGEAAQPLRCETELVAHLHRAQGHPARVLLRVRVLLRERDQESAHMRSQERLLFRDEIRPGQVAQERTRASRAPAQIEGDRDADGRDPDDLEGVPEPPAEVPVAEQERRGERGGQPHDADPDEEVRPPPREPEGAERPPEENRVEHHAPKENRPDSEAARLGNGRNEARLRHRGETEGEDEDDAGGEEPEKRTDGRRPAQGRDRSEREDRASDRQGRAAGERDDPVHLHDDARGREPVQAEERGHDRERAADDDRVPVPQACPRDGQRDRGRGCDPRSEGDAREVDPAADEDLLAADEVEQGGRNDRHERRCPDVRIGTRDVSALGRRC